MIESQRPRPGPRNLITDVEGLTVGNAEDPSALTGVTVILPDRPVAAAADVRGGAPGTRDIEALAPECLIEGVHGAVLAGGSVFGLDAAGGVIAWLAARGVGFTFGEQPLPCPVVPSAILFDLMNGGSKGWGLFPPYRALGIAAAEAAGKAFALGNAGAGLGATAGIFKGGLGSTSAVLGDLTIGALVAVNSFGSPADPATGDLWARPLALGQEMGPWRKHKPRPARGSILAWSKAERQGAAPGANTTIAVVATDADLDKGEARRFAIMAADGMARALKPVHSPYDGDTVIALATGRRRLAEPRPLHLAIAGELAAHCLARAIGRGVWEASTLGAARGYRDAFKG
jgi:L-aminopeptidase/D-esterase-like protein